MNTTNTGKPILDALLNASESFEDDKPTQTETSNMKTNKEIGMLTQDLSQSLRILIQSGSANGKESNRSKLLRLLPRIIDASNHYDDLKRSAERLAEALKECLVAHSRDNYYNSLRRVASAQAALEALAQWEQQR